MRKQKRNVDNSFKKHGYVKENKALASSGPQVKNFFFNGRDVTMFICKKVTDHSKEKIILNFIQF